MNQSRGSAATSDFQSFSNDNFVTVEEFKVLENKLVKRLSDALDKFGSVLKIKILIKKLI